MDNKKKIETLEASLQMIQILESADKNFSCDRNVKN